MEISSRNRLIKVGVVLAGYVAAALAAWAALYVRLLHTQGPDAQASAGMYAFGDLLLVVAVFGFVALLPTGLALYFLRPFRKLWIALSIAALALAATGLFSAALYGLEHTRPLPSGSLLDILGALAILRMLGAPLLAAAFLIAGILSPARLPRWALLAAAGIEGSVCAYTFFIWYVP